jgi:putative Flp pilus-assembly TadE/G-like protein
MAGRRRQRGQAIVIIALMLTVLMGMVAIAVDGSRAYSLRLDLQDASDSAALAAADTFQQTGSYISAEQAATTIFGKNMRLYAAPACTGYGTPGASPWTATCTYPDGTVMTDVARVLGAQGSRFTITGTRNVQLQFARILTNGTSPSLGASSNGSIGNLVYSPALAALKQSGCGGVAGTALTVNGTGTLRVTGDVVATGSVSVAAGSLRVAGDVYARCQSSIAGTVSACYPSGASTPCTFPDVAGATRSGFRLPDPGYPAPPVGGTSSFATSDVIVPAGVYASAVSIGGGHCWFLSGGVDEFLAGLVNNGDLVSNELKPPDEPDPGNNAARAANQFWDADGAGCSGEAAVNIVGGARGIPVGNWAFMLTSTRTDAYGGVGYTRESAPSICYPQNVNNSGQIVKIDVSNVPGATAYNIYASPPQAGGTCSGTFGLVASLPVSFPVQNNNTTACPLPTGGGCSLGNESIRLDNTVLTSTFTPNAGAAPGTTGAYPPDGERAPLAAGLPNQNPSRGVGSAGDRANENNCKTVGNVLATCPAAITPGAVELYFPTGGCFANNSGDNYIFSGYQYNWVSVYEPPANTCTNTLGASSNSAYIGLFYAPGANVNINSPNVFDSSGTGGVMAGAVTFTGTLPSINQSASYSPVPPAARLVS